MYFHRTYRHNSLLFSLLFDSYPKSFKVKTMKILKQTPQLLDTELYLRDNWNNFGVIYATCLHEPFRFNEIFPWCYTSRLPFNISGSLDSMAFRKKNLIAGEMKCLCKRPLKVWNINNTFSFFIFRTRWSVRQKHVQTSWMRMRKRTSTTEGVNSKANSTNGFDIMGRWWVNNI